MPKKELGLGSLAAYSVNHALFRAVLLARHFQTNPDEVRLEKKIEDLQSS